MNFAELRFWQILVTGLILIIGCRWMAGRRAGGLPGWFDKVGLLVLGLTLLWFVSGITFLIFLTVAIGTYVGLGWIQTAHPRQARLYLLLLIPLQLLPLFYFKYADFVGNRVLGLNLDALHRLVIPVGISFYTFQKIAFVIDTLLRGEPRPRFLDYMNFAAFFPQIVAGPIERRADLLPQVEQFQWRWRAGEINRGASWICLGLFFKCCLADNFSTYLRIQSATNPIAIWLANVVFGLRIYYDFAGYSLVAVGLARCLGVRLTLNFLSPYCATSIAEFWRRWHVTLSQWFRDYLYLPLGGGRVSWWIANVAVVFLVSGIWHGAGWNFALWGGLHAVYFVVHRWRRDWKLPPPAAWALTMVVSFLAWLPFYELRPTVLWQKFVTVLTPLAYTSAAVREAFQEFASADLCVLGGLFCLAGLTLLLEWLSIRRQDDPYYYLRQPRVLGFLLVLTVWLAPEKDIGFIYFAF